MATPDTTPTTPAAPGSPPPVPRNGFGITALCLALVGVLFGFIPLTGFIAVGLGVLALVFGALGFARARKGIATNTKMSVTSLVLAAGAVALGIWGLTILYSATEDFVNDMNQINQQLNQDTAPLEQFGNDMDQLGRNLESHGAEIEQNMNTPQGG